MTAKNINILERALSSSDRVLMGESLKIAIKDKESELQSNAESRDFVSYRRNANQFAHLSETLYNLRNA